jgi:misacylated tRNA(Ala) deacylase
MTTAFLFRDDAYLTSVEAEVTAVGDGGFELDRTVFYATSGGQPGDTGTAGFLDGSSTPIAGAVHPDGDKTRIVHLLAEGSALPLVGTRINVSVDWERRYRLMRIHTALHLLSVVLPYPVTGGSIGEDRGRLDFDMPEAPGDTQAIEDALNALVADDHAVTTEWISDEQMAAQPEMIKTMKVRPPMGQGRVRLVRIGDIDLQPCGGTHVRSTAEIGPLRMGKVEKKGRENRRVSIVFG